MVKSRSDEDGETSTAASDRNLFKLVAVSFGLLCITQAALNVSLRLILYTKDSSMLEMELVQLQSRYRNLTEEQDQLKDQLKHVTNERYYRQRKLHFLNPPLNQEHSLQSQWCSYFGGSLYYISVEEESWQKSREDCLQKGADLIIINNREEQEFARRFRKRFWIGLTYVKTQRAWKWVDGTPLTTGYWSPNEPNNALGNETCAEIRDYFLGSNWNDEPCNLKKFWICEKEVL